MANIKKRRRITKEAQQAATERRNQKIRAKAQAEAAQLTLPLLTVIPKP